MPSTTIKIKGSRRVINFKNSGHSEWNDVIHDKVFRLENRDYVFVLEPNTNFWRFGLRLFRTREIPFSTSSRHINEGNIDIQLAVGTWYKPQNRWENAKQIELGQYNINTIDHVIDRFTEYTSLNKVEFVVGRSSSNMLNLAYTTGEYKASKEIPVDSEFRYFRLFAWADMIDFDLDCFPIPFPLEELESIKSFRIGKVSFRKADLFDNDIVSESDLIVLPCSNSGSTQPTISDAAKLLNIPLPTPKNVGEFEIIGLKNPISPPFWGWAYSVDDQKSIDDEKSNIGIVEQIINKILASPKLTNGQTVGLPLLGTGAGGLDIFDVANLYLDIVNKSDTQLRVVVAVNNELLFEELVEHYQSEVNPEYDVIASYANKFAFRDKDNIDPVLNVKDIAAELAEVINGIPGSENEGMIGIFGKWGRGKTYLTKEVWKLIGKQPNVLRVDFHAWKYQDTPAIWGYLFEQFAERYYSISKYWTGKIWRRIRLNINRIGYLAILYFLIPLSVSIYWSLSFTLWEKIGLLFGSQLLSLIIIYYRYGKSAKSLFRSYTQKVSFFKLLGIQAEVQKELKCLINTWTKHFEMDKVILFVEDIDRCSENKIIEIIDALRVMLEEKEISSRVTVITTIDENILKRVIGHKYSKLTSSTDDLDSIIIEYLDKLFIVGIRLGQLSQREKDEYFIELTKNDRDKFDISPFSLDEVFREESISTRSELERSKKKESVTEVSQQTARAEVVNGERDPRNERGKKASSGLNNYEKIHQKEFEVLRAGLLEHKSITPRQIRIFYFRYIIAKNLLERSYVKNDLINIWARNSYSKILVKMLISFSQDEGRKTLDKHKIEMLHSTNAKQRVYQSELSIDTWDYRELLKVLDVVIAY